MNVRYLGIVAALFITSNGNAESTNGTGIQSSLSVLDTTLNYENGTGTGLLTESMEGASLKLSLSEDQRLILSVSESSRLIQGSAQLEQGYGQLVLDAFELEQEAIEANWGNAEILLGCYQADILIEQAEQTTVAGSFTTDYCPQ